MSTNTEPWCKKILRISWHRMVDHAPEVAGKHPIMSPESASGTHQEILELCSPLDNTGQAHPCSL